ncbi:5,6-dimethylbenzimidazole synthase [Poseidonibacter lekithochrous]|uniref:5,6-dimethylbenzimidazole synthase n=1 Tax=Poseidonibacter lekithochrous TaxID=1904463 RepID=UPI0008FC8748|nr:5,6-dimethylbenzimidazole synthase [Poseidonibacter lekithochrous]QKJ21634.1 5,6-dimethylbenzimidazole synthase [Poseidonibacter lekithochrous]
MNITEEEKEAVYKTIYNRRDTRGEFLPDEISDEVINRILDAAHHSPSVGFMQPWDFIVIKDKDVKQDIKNAFVVAHDEAKEMFDDEKKNIYSKLKLEGITEAPIGICITCDRNRTGDTVIGRTANLEMDLYSSVCAVQTLWLAARAENLGVGWVSIIHHEELKEVLDIPSHITPIAYLCIGKVSHFHDKPELEKAGWLPRLPLENLVHHDKW